ncbi:MAG: CHAT domain-containing protein, partial [Cyanobacteria bacterium P01_H01_bin.121]
GTFQEFETEQNLLFSDYLGIEAPEPISLQEAQSILQDLQEQTGVNTVNLILRFRPPGGDILQLDETVQPDLEPEDLEVRDLEVEDLEIEDLENETLGRYDAENQTVAATPATAAIQLDSSTQSLTHTKLEPSEEGLKQLEYAKGATTQLDQLENFDDPLAPWLGQLTAGEGNSSDQLEAIVIQADGEARVISLDITRGRLQQLLNLTYRRIDGRSSFMAGSRRIYDSIFTELEPTLAAAGTESILFSLDEGLRLFPWAALHDGEQFLVEKYSLAIAPSLSLTDTRYQPLQGRNTLVMGAEEFVDQPPLPAVPVEVETVAAETGSNEFFLDQTFTIENLQAARTQLNPGIIHLATHADFNPGDLGQSFIQFWGDERLNLNRMRDLEWFTNPAVELLVLSACETAFGSPEAELGFGGLAVNAGIRSALASLWNVSDAGTLSLMAEFYDRLQDPTITTKAEALRQAQIAMLRGEIVVEEGILRSGAGDERGIEIPLPDNLQEQAGVNLTHPYYWASFTLIGSPW